MHAITAVFSVPFRKEELTRTRKWGRRGCIDRLIGSFNSEGNVTFEQWGQWFTWLQNNSRAVSEERSTIADSNEMKVNDPRRQFMALYLSSSEYGQQSKGLIFFWPYSICSSKTYSCFTSYLHSWSCSPSSCFDWSINLRQRRKRPFNFNFLLFSAQVHEYPVSNSRKKHSIKRSAKCPHPCKRLSQLNYVMNYVIPADWFTVAFVYCHENCIKARKTCMEKNFTLSGKVCLPKDYCITHKIWKIAIAMGMKTTFFLC